MATATKIRLLEKLGRVQLSRSFHMRDFLFSEIAQVHGATNLPDDPDLVIEAGRQLCQRLLEPIQDALGKVHIVTGYRSEKVHRLCMKHGHCSPRGEPRTRGHIWGRTGATVQVVIPRFVDYLKAGGDWRALACWIHAFLPYSELYFFAADSGVGIRWDPKPRRIIHSYIAPRGTLTELGTNRSARRRIDHRRDSGLFRPEDLLTMEERLNLGELQARDMTEVARLVAKRKLSREERDRILDIFVRYATSDVHDTGDIASELANYIAREFKKILRDTGEKPFPVRQGKREVVDWETVYTHVSVMTDFNDIANVDGVLPKKLSLDRRFRQALSSLFPDVEVSEETIRNHYRKFLKDPMFRSK